MNDSINDSKIKSRTKGSVKAIFSCSFVDMLGVPTAILCAIHCFGAPFFVLLFSMLGWEGFYSLRWDYFLTISAFLLGSYSMMHGYLYHGTKWSALSMFVVGFTLLLFSKISHSHTHHEPALTYGYSLELVLTGLAGATLALAHFLNWQASHHHCSQKSLSKFASHSIDS